MVLGQFSDICGPWWSTNIRKLAKYHKGYGSAAMVIATICTAVASVDIITVHYHRRNKRKRIKNIYKDLCQVYTKRNTRVVVNTNPTKTGNELRNGDNV